MLQVFLAVSIALPTLGTSLPASDAGRLSRYLNSLPATQPPVLDQVQVASLAALPLSCIDHPQPLQDHAQTYLWVYDDKAQLVEEDDKNRAFYGCYDWHSAANSTWTVVAILKQNSKMFLAPVIRQRLTDHLGKDNIAGEVKFFSYFEASDSEGNNFERPYGYTWLLKLHGKLESWTDPDAQKLAANVQPLVALLADKYVSYLGQHWLATYAVLYMQAQAAFPRSEHTKDGRVDHIEEVQQCFVLTPRCGTFHRSAA